MHGFAASRSSNRHSRAALRDKSSLLAGPGYDDPTAHTCPMRFKLHATYTGFSLWGPWVRHVPVALQNAHIYATCNWENLHPIPKLGWHCFGRAQNAAKRESGAHCAAGNLPAEPAKKKQTQSERLNHAPANVPSQHSRLARRGARCQDQYTAPQRSRARRAAPEARPSWHGGLSKKEQGGFSAPAQLPLEK